MASVSTNDLSERGLMAALEAGLGMLGLERGSGLSASTALSGLRDLRQRQTAWLDFIGPGLGRGHPGRLLEGTALLGAPRASTCRPACGSFARDWQEVMVPPVMAPSPATFRRHQSWGVQSCRRWGAPGASQGRVRQQRFAPDDLRQWDPDASAAEICDQAQAMLRADYVEAGSYRVLQPLRGVIFHEACGHPARNHQVRGGHHPSLKQVGSRSPMRPGHGDRIEGLSSGVLRQPFDGRRRHGA